MAFSYILGHLVGIVGAVSSILLMGIFIFYPPSIYLEEWPFKLEISIILFLNLIASCNWIFGVYKNNVRKLKHSLIWYTIPALSINYCILMLLGCYIMDVPISSNIWFGVSLISLFSASAAFLVFYAFVHLSYYLLKKMQRDEKESPRSDISYSKTDTLEDEFKWQRKY